MHKAIILIIVALLLFPTVFMAITSCVSASIGLYQITKVPKPDNSGELYIPYELMNINNTEVNGTVLLIVSMQAEYDSDGDSIPDTSDEYPHDFDNDGLDDIDDMDDDNDGITDFNDYCLEQMDTNVVLHSSQISENYQFQIRFTENETWKNMDEGYSMNGGYKWDTAEYPNGHYQIQAKWNMDFNTTSSTWENETIYTYNVDVLNIGPEEDKSVWYANKILLSTVVGVIIGCIVITELFIHNKRDSNTDMRNKKR